MATTHQNQSGRVRLATFLPTITAHTAVRRARPSFHDATAPSMADQVSQLADLHEQGVLSDSEFAAAKAKLLGT